ncbi:MFS transporter [Arenicella xantha]|uniref:MFS transporter n=1 Tax=Arenicella xantha TaxID=644221 RepID=A0A395JGE0_9GAMM|nr:MFS transporter [Arenicella xantha]RBP48536.1 MFS transporter [Arenicella xantha]
MTASANSQRAEPTELEPISREGLSLLVILAGSFLAPLLMHSTTLAIPSMAADLRLTAESVSLLTLGHILSSACMVLPAGKLADIYGRRKIFSIGTLISGCACLLGGFADSAISLIAARCLQGAGGAFIFASALALVNSIPPPQHKARVMGIYIAIAYLGIVVGPLFGGYVLTHTDWRWVFILPGIALLLTGFIGSVCLSWERYGNRNTRLRWLDTSLYMLSLGLIAVSVFKTGALIGQFMLLAGLAAFGGFCWFQTKRKDPLLQVSLFLHNPVFALLGTVNFLAYSAILALSFTLTLFLQYILGLDALTTGWLLISQALLTALVAPMSGRLTERYKIKDLLLIGFTIMLLGMLCFAVLGESSSVWLVIIGLALVGLSIGIVDTQIIHTALNSVSHEQLGSASATLNGLRSMGGFVGIGIVSYLMSLYLGRNEIVPALYAELYSMLHVYFIVAALLVAVALLLLVVGLIKRDTL